MNTFKDMMTQHHNYYIHWKVCRNYNIMTSADKWYEQKSETAFENEQATILWNMPIHTDREI